MKLIEVRNLTKEYNGVKVLDNVSLTVNSGESVAIIGPSGVGKSTILRLIAGLEEIDSGEITVNDEEFSMVFQYSALLNSYTVGENIELALQHKKVKKEDRDKTISERLRLVGLEQFKNSYPDQLSGGQKKRVGFARAIACDPKIVLYDEPTAGLDPVLTTRIEDYINKLSTELNVSSIIVTHHLSTIRRTASRVLMLFDGKFVFEGTPDDFFKTDNPYVKQFVNASIEGPLLKNL